MHTPHVTELNPHKETVSHDTFIDDIPSRPYGFEGKDNSNVSVSEEKLAAAGLRIRTRHSKPSKV
jgi:hypothetical protein